MDDLGDMQPSWIKPEGIAAATVAQREIAAVAERMDRIDPVRRIAGADTSMKWRDSRGPIHAAIAPMAWPPGDAIAPACVTDIPDIPYVPGYLGFRESPVLIQAWEKLADKPDLILVDGHGISHPRRCGIATHLGVLLDVPTIGCAKTILCGRVEGELDQAPGSRALLVDRGEMVGMALRTRAKALPIYVSTGHRISLDTAIEWVLRLCDGRRLPVPIRMAHDAANAARRAAGSE